MSKSSLKPQGIVILVHGFNKKSQDMQYLNHELHGFGWTCVTVNLPTLFGDINACVESLHQQVKALVENDRYKALLSLPVHFVCHSMGGLIVRQFIKKHWQTTTQTLRIPMPLPSSIHPGHCVFIATPHRGSHLANYAVLIPGYKRVFKTISALLPDAGYQQLPANRPFKAGLIAGNKSAGLLGSLLARPNDGHVEVKSVRTDDADAFIELPYHHKEIHHQRQTAVLTHRFLLHGCWDH